MNINICVDGGYGYWKLLVNDKQIKFRNLFGEFQAGTDLLSNDGSLLSLEIDNLGGWTFGNTAALQAAFAGRVQESKWILDNDYLAGLLLGISEGYSSSTHHITASILTGLPGQDYKQPGVINQFKDFVKGEYGIRRQGKKQTVLIEDVRVTSQAYGPLFYHLIDDRGRFSRPDSKARSVRIGSINLGFRTCEIDTIEIPDTSRPVLKATKQWKSEPVGVHTILENFRQWIQRQFLGERFNDDQLIAILEDGGTELYGKWYDVNPVEIKRDFAKSIRNLASTVWGDDLKSLYWLVLTGGGASLVWDYFNEIEYHKNIKISESPQWDIVKGYQKVSRIGVKHEQ